MPPAGADTKAYCLKCRKKIALENARMAKTKNGRPMLKGTCPVCSTKCNKFLPGTA